MQRDGAAAGIDAAHARCDFEPGGTAVGTDGGWRAAGTGSAQRGGGSDRTDRDRPVSRWRRPDHGQDAQAVRGAAAPDAGGRRGASGDWIYRSDGTRRVDDAGARRIGLLGGTILGAAMAAAEVIIWTDVDGVSSADPRGWWQRRVPFRRFRIVEATELAYFGAKVLHPKRCARWQSKGFRCGSATAFRRRKAGPNHAEGAQQRRRSESADGNQRCDADQPGRPGHRRDDGRGGADVLDDRGSTCQCTADISIVIAKRYLLHRFVRGRKAHGGSAARRIRARTWRTRKWSTSRWTRTSPSWRWLAKYARHAGSGGAGVHRAGAGKCEHHRDRARVVGVEHFVLWPRPDMKRALVATHQEFRDWARLSCSTNGDGS